MNGRSESCICVAGWHFPETTFRALREIQGLDVFLVSHRPLREIPAAVLDSVPRENVLVAPNRGYDWGCYEQFRRWGRWKDYRYVFFMHDDVDVLSPGFVPASIALLERHSVVGNSRMSTARNVTEVAPEGYLHSAWKPPARSFRHDNVRGSFFATTRDALERLGGFEVFWDRFGFSCATGNLSTRASCAKWEHLFGDRCFGFLSETPCKSPFIHEHVRGQAEGAANEPANSAGRFRRWAINDVYSRFGKVAMACYWGETGAWKKRAVLALAKPVVWLFCGNG